MTSTHFSTLHSPSADIYHMFTLQQSSEYLMLSMHVLQNVHTMFTESIDTYSFTFQILQEKYLILSTHNAKLWTSISCILTIPDELPHLSEYLYSAKTHAQAPPQCSYVSSILSLHPLSPALILFQISITAIPCHETLNQFVPVFSSFIPFPFALLFSCYFVFLSFSSYFLQLL
jgi:hypothetical protein